MAAQPLPRLQSPDRMQSKDKEKEAAPAARPPRVVSWDSLASPHAERFPFLC